MTSPLQTSESAVYRKIKNELVVVQLETAHYYYFNCDTETVLRFFQTPRKLSDLKDRIGSDRGEEIERFCRLLLEKQILKSATQEGDASFEGELSGLDPKLLREGEKRIDEISFFCP